MTRSRPADVGVLIGMTVGQPQLDVESALKDIADAGFGAAEVFLGQLGPRIVDVPLYGAHARAVSAYMRHLGLAVSTFNGIFGEFDPFSSAASFDAGVEFLVDRLRLASAIGATRLLIWDGELTDRRLLPQAPQILASCIAAAQSRLDGPGVPDVCVELHPNTFALKFGATEDTAAALREVGAGICLDVCHFAVAMGPDFAAELSETVLAAVTHVHFADSDGRSEQLHFPPGEGVVDLAALADRLSARGLPVAWDLFGWPAPRDATSRCIDRYREFVAQVGGGASLA